MWLPLGTDGNVEAAVKQDIVAADETLISGLLKDLNTTNCTAPSQDSTIRRQMNRQCHWTLPFATGTIPSSSRKLLFLNRPEIQYASLNRQRASTRSMRRPKQCRCRQQVGIGHKRGSRDPKDKLNLTSPHLIESSRRGCRPTTIPAVPEPSTRPQDSQDSTPSWLGSTTTVAAAHGLPTTTRSPSAWALAEYCADTTRSR
jgi:hypothetical protein